MANNIAIDPAEQTRIALHNCRCFLEEEDNYALLPQAQRQGDESLSFRVARQMYVTCKKLRALRNLTPERLSVLEIQFLNIMNVNKNELHNKIVGLIPEELLPSFRMLSA